MLGSKRSCPFADVECNHGPAKVRKEDYLSIYEATLMKLKLGSLAATCRSPQTSECHLKGAKTCRQGLKPPWSWELQAQGKVRDTAKASGPTAGTQCPSLAPPERAGHFCCYVCLSRPSEKFCFHCTRGCCELCCKTCFGCQELFCSICSTSNYDERDDRSFCLDCNPEVNGSNCSDDFACMEVV